MIPFVLIQSCFPYCILWLHCTVSIRWLFRPMDPWSVTFSKQNKVTIWIFQVFDLKRLCRFCNLFALPTANGWNLKISYFVISDFVNLLNFKYCLHLWKDQKHMFFVKTNVCGKTMWKKWFMYVFILLEFMFFSLDKNTCSRDIIKIKVYT